jgi:hypothetical protein
MSYCVVEDMMGVVNRVRLKSVVLVGRYLLRSEENERLRGAVWCSISIEESSEGTVGTCTYMFAV